MSKIQVSSDCELVIEKKTLQCLQKSIEQKHQLYVAAKEREYEVTQQKNKAMIALKEVSTKCAELMIKNKQSKITDDDLLLNKKFLDGDALEKHVIDKYENSDSKKSFDNEIEYLLNGISHKITNAPFSGLLSKKINKK